ncbi:hypothetical protein [Pararcticibacter amylolyticus]|uniref:Uncharacterized protein n=1 Tax=Pararcticibacter amylolyticus TaxID=2173175 RepID=A0A2U2PFY9_9SPHI|nr:hypothetical protein [Pararcticibacter amylolyticus]PWG80293.1 hypothetical protein DDR33_11800 [Pararcticibacter amylolyticus]
MEKITFPPLVEYLRENAAEYNQLYYQQELKSGKMDPVLLSRWIVRVVEPIVAAAAEVSPESLPVVFKSFYVSLLSLLTGNLSLTYERQYEEAWSLCGLVPGLIAKQPQRMINALNSALLSLRQYQPGRVGDWIRLMGQTAIYCKTTVEFLNCGRITAWLCGMSHLREKAIMIYPGLAEEIKTVMKSEKLPASPDDLLNHPWTDAAKFKFQGVAGGFHGYGNAFTRPPLVAGLNGRIVASDGNTCCALFADALGTVLIRDVPLATERVTTSASVLPAKPFTEKDLNIRLCFDDMTSCVTLNSSVVITRSSSHYLFIYNYPEIN